MNANWIALARRLALWVAIGGLSTSMLACSAAAVGTSLFASDSLPVTFNWTSQDGGSTGTMSARTADGVEFSGPFVQVTRTTTSDALEPMWTGWRHGWSGWGDFRSQLVTTAYTDHAVANLQGNAGQRLRCHFSLTDPTDGMAGGGSGKCQLAGGGGLRAVFPRA